MVHIGNVLLRIAKYVVKAGVYLGAHADQIAAIVALLKAKDQK